MEIRFVADAMLGRLARWLRVLGYDTHYQPFYGKETLAGFVSEGRTLLSRHRNTAGRYPRSLWLHSDHVGDQVREMREAGLLHQDRSGWFTRCVVCNVPLEAAPPHIARENVPDHVFYQIMKGIRFCPSCNRHYWPGSHRDRMLKQMKEWGF